MKAVSVDFDRLLGYKLIVRAKKAVEQDDSIGGQSSESGAMDDFAAVLQARIGMKPIIGLRYRGA
jgi:hypothetical protein